MDSTSLEYQKHYIFLDPSFDAWSDGIEWAVFKDGHELAFGSDLNANKIILEAKAFIDKRLLSPRNN